jgi:hypothetical protein
MERGYIKLKNSTFNNGYSKGIHLKIAENVTISENCVFTWDNSVPGASNWNLHPGIYISGSSLSSEINIQNCNFSCQIPSGAANNKIAVTGVYIDGSEFGIAGETKIDMSGCLFNLNNYGGSNAITIFGDLPTTSKTKIHDNYVDVRLDGNYGILGGNGSTNNLEIYSNIFSQSEFDPGWVDAIYLAGSEGEGNIVTNNECTEASINPWLERTYFSLVALENFKNTLICSNLNRGASALLYAYGENDNTTFRQNHTYNWTNIATFFGSYIDAQENMGNKWEFDTYGSPITTTSDAAYCFDPSYAFYSLFYVHEEQSTALTGAGFNLFHPFKIVPDGPGNEWWIHDELGMPADECPEPPNKGFNVENLKDNKRKRDVADGIFSSTVSNVALNWRAERSLFFDLEKDPGLRGMYSGYNSFYQNKLGSSLDKFSQVFKLTDSARNGKINLRNQAIDNTTNLNLLIAQIEEADTDWQNSSLEVQGNIQKSKIDYLISLSALLENTNMINQQHSQDIHESVQIMKEINYSVSPSNIWEHHEKTVNDALLTKLDGQEWDSETIENIIDIANACPQNDGMAVYKARGILPLCKQNIIFEGVPNCFERQALPTHITEVNNERTSLNINDNQFALYPNPVSDNAVLVLKEWEGKSVSMYNIYGNKIYEHKIQNNTTPISFSQLSSGIYILLIRQEGENDTLIKVNVIK